MPRLDAFSAYIAVIGSMRDARHAGRRLAVRTGGDDCPDTETKVLDPAE